MADINRPSPFFFFFFFFHSFSTGKLRSTWIEKSILWLLVAWGHEFEQFSVYCEREKMSAPSSPVDLVPRTSQHKVTTASILFKGNVRNFISFSLHSTWLEERNVFLFFLSFFFFFFLSFFFLSSSFAYFFGLNRRLRTKSCWKPFRTWRSNSNWSLRSWMELRICWRVWQRRRTRSGKIFSLSQSFFLSFFLIFYFDKQIKYCEKKQTINRSLCWRNWRKLARMWREFVRSLLPSTKRPSPAMGALIPSQVPFFSFDLFLFQWSGSFPRIGWC